MMAGINNCSKNVLRQHKTLPKKSSYSETELAWGEQLGRLGCLLDLG